jgi:hypothetical protein
MLQSVQDEVAGVRIIAYLDDIILQGPYDAVRRAYSELREQLAAAGLQIQREKSIAYSPDAEFADNLAFQLGCQCAAEGSLVAGCPVGKPQFVTAKTIAAAEGVQQLVNTLMELQVPVQDKLLVLRKSLQVKVVHFARCVPFELVESSLLKSEAAVLTAVSSLIGRQEADLDVQQLYLPLREGGLGLLRLTESQGVVSRAGFLAAAALTQKALQGGENSFQPLSDAGVAALGASWEQVVAYCRTSELDADPLPNSLLEAHAAGLLQLLQRKVSGVARERRRGNLFGKYRALLGDEATRVHAQEHLARLHSLQEGVVSCWLEVKPTKDQWELDDATVNSALRFMLGVNPVPPEQACFSVHVGTRDLMPTMQWCVTNYRGFAFCATTMFNHWCNAGLAWQVIHLALNPRKGT